MANISGHDTKPEIEVRRFLFAKGYRFRKNDPRYPGKPDIILPRHETAILIHGCFWHGHSCKAGQLPVTNKRFWKKKIIGNIERDKKTIKALRALGWNVIVVWQCQIKNAKQKKRRLFKLVQEIGG